METSGNASLIFGLRGEWFFLHITDAVILSAREKNTILFFIFLSLPVNAIEEKGDEKRKFVLFFGAVDVRFPLDVKFPTNN
jgi:hypothetical protein